MNLLWKESSYMFNWDVWRWLNCSGFDSHWRPSVTRRLERQLLNVFWTSYSPSKFPLSNLTRLLFSHVQNFSSAWWTGKQSCTWPPIHRANVFPIVMLADYLPMEYCFWRSCNSEKDAPSFCHVASSAEGYCTNSERVKAFSVWQI